MQRLIIIWDKLKSSFWFVPIVIVVVGILSALSLLYFDRYLDDYQPKGIFQFVFSGSVESARIVLSTIAGAMIGVAGTVFSITLVALSLATNQFGSRLIRNFMHNRLNQIVLGTYISMFAYCLIILNTIENSDQFSFIPYFSILFAILATIVNIILLIFFIHNISVSIQANHVISNVYKSLASNITELFPERLGEDDPEKESVDVASLLKDYPYQQDIKFKDNGYLQYVNAESMLKDAIDQDRVFQIDHKPGDYLVQDLVIGHIYAKEPLEEDMSEKMQQYFISGEVRTALQDSEFSIHQMVEIASRALSPGINDPYTAIACIDNLTSIFSYLATVKFPSKFRYDEEGDLRVITEPVTYKKMLNTAFNQIRQYSDKVPIVIIHLMQSLTVIRKFTKHSSQIEAITRHAEMLLRAAEKSFMEQNDLDDLKQCGKTVLPK